MFIVVFEETWTEWDSIDGIMVLDEPGFVVVLVIVLVTSVVVMVVMAPVSVDETSLRISVFWSFL